MLSTTQPVGLATGVDWHRLTLKVRRNGDGYSDFLQVFLNGELLSHAKARVTPEGAALGGTWFCLTHDEVNPVPSVCFRGTGFLDDVVVTETP